MSIHKRIAYARSLASLTQSEIAKYFGISRPAVSQWESEEGTTPEADKLAKLAKLCAVSLDWLLSGEGSPRNISGMQEDLLGLLPDATEITRGQLRDALGLLERALEENALDDTDLQLVSVIIDAARQRKQKQSAAASAR